MKRQVLRLIAALSLAVSTVVGSLIVASSPASARPISEAQQQCASYQNGVTRWVSYSGGYACWWYGSGGGWTVDFYAQDGTWEQTCTGDSLFVPKYCF